MAQRLVRTLCRQCREPFEPKREDLPPDFPWEEYQATGEPLYAPKGCRECRQIGYSGRRGIYELSITSDRIRQLAHDNVSSWEIRKAALEEGMRTLRQDGWLKVLSGVTTVDEVLRVSKGDRM
jgi:general secretion pathway protein E/type IV pilus assembly protein PilB